MLNVIDVLTDLFILRGVPGHVRSDNGPEFIAEAVRDWIDAVGANTAFIEPGNPWENGYGESFNSKLRVELLNGEIFYGLAEAKIVIEGWRQHHNTKRPPSSLGYRPPAPEIVQWPAPPSGDPSPATPAIAPGPVTHQDQNRTTRWGQATLRSANVLARTPDCDCLTYSTPVRRHFAKARLRETCRLR